MFKDHFPRRKSISWIRNTAGNEGVVVTPRHYNVVSTGLRLPDNYFSTDELVLSVGEGLSDFGNVLEARNINVYSIDPIYELGKQLFQKSPVIVKNTLRHAYQGRVILSSGAGLGKFMQNDELPLPNPKRVVAGSVYDLPFTNGSFSKILSFKLFEHIDFSQALTELLGILKPDGEIRMGGLRLHVDTKRRIISDQEIIMNNNFEGYCRPHPGLGDSMDILAKSDSLSTYALIDGFPGAKVGRRFPDIRIGSVLIIRNNSQLPLISNLNGRTSDNNLNKLVRVTGKVDDGEYSVSFVN